MSHIFSCIQYKQLMSKQQIKSILAQAKTIREQSRTTSVTLQNYLYYQYLKVTDESSSVWGCGLCSTPKAQVSKCFKNAFKKMDRLQKAHFYLMNVKNVSKALKNERSDSKVDEKKIKDFRNTYEYEITHQKVMVKGGYKFSKWSTVTLQFFQKEKLIKISETKQEIDLEFYLLRRSKNKDRMIFVLEPTTQIPNSQFRISQGSIQFEDLYTKVKGLWAQAQFEKVKKMLSYDGKSLRSKQKIKVMRTSIEMEQIETVPLTLRLSKKAEKEEERESLKRQISILTDQSCHLGTTKCIQNNKIQEELVPQEFLYSLMSLRNFEQKMYGVYYDKSGKKVRKIFTFPREVPESLILYVINDIRHAKKRKQSIMNLKALKCLPEQQTGIFQQIDQYGEQDIQYVFFRHFFCKNGSSYYLQKSIELQELGLPKSSQISRANIEYCIWRVRTYGNQVQLLAQAEISYDKRIKNPQELMSQYIGEFIQYINEKCLYDLDSEFTEIQTEDFENQYLSAVSQENSNNLSDFVTVNGSFQDEQEISLCLKKESFSKKQCVLEEVCTYERAQSQEINFSKEELIRSADLITHKFPVHPLPKHNPHFLFYETGHPIWGHEWIINDQGYLVNVNEQKIKIQSSVLKLVVQRMGRNLLSGKSILNMSLPIEIFGTDSNLERLAKGYIYAPRFLQAAAKMSNPVDRFKRILCFGLGFSISYIEMQKPFNPIIGETYQGLIDGCPVYGEQTSHHPPISSLYMEGRGYTIHGNFEAKVEMGVNSASGINDGFNCLCFSEYPGVVRFNGPPGQISGLVYGERKLTLVKKSYFIDEQNRLFMEVSWGKNKNGRNSLGKYVDYFSGKIVKIKEGVNLCEYKKIKSSNIQRQFGEIYGRVNDKVYFENEQLFNISKDYPYRMQDYFPCLESDSRMRKDITVRKTRDFIRAQQAKEQLQNIQRRDRKLRSQAQK